MYHNWHQHDNQNIQFIQGLIYVWFKKFETNSKYNAMTKALILKHFGENTCI